MHTKSDIYVIIITGITETRRAYYIRYLRYYYYGYYRNSSCILSQISTLLLLRVLQKLFVHTKSDIYVIIITGITETRRAY